MKAMESEINSLNTNKVWDLAELPCCGADKHVDPANVLSLMRASNDSQRQ